MTAIRTGRIILRLIICLAVISSMWGGTAWADEDPCLVRHNHSIHKRSVEFFKEDIRVLLDQMVAAIVKNAKAKGVDSVAVLDAVGPCRAVTGFSIHITQELRQLLLKPGRIKNVIERRRLYRLNAIMRRQQGPDIDEKTRVQFGQKLGVQAVLIPEITRQGKAYAVTCRLDDLARGVILAEQSVTVQESPLILNMLSERPRADLTVLVEPFENTKVTLNKTVKPAERTGVVFSDLPLGMHTLSVTCPCYETNRLEFYLPRRFEPSPDQAGAQGISLARYGQDSRAAPGGDYRQSGALSFGPHRLCADRPAQRSLCHHPDRG
jgi:hypothetical protein